MPTPSSVYWSDRLARVDRSALFGRARAAGVVLFVLLAASTAPAAEPIRVAVISTSAARDTGVPAVAVSLLHGDAVISLADRNRVEAAAGEEVVQAMLAAGPAGADHARVGEAVGAGFLAIVHVADGKLRLTVMHARLGVSLSTQSFGPTVGGATVNQLATAVAEEVRATVGRFGGGVDYVVAVPDFVSGDLSPEHAFLRSDYAEVLRAAYRQLPGVALVSPEEAQALAARAAPPGRPAPLFVEGEYRTDRTNGDGRSVRLTLHARETTRFVVDRESEPMPLDKAGPYLLALFARDLAPLATGKAAAAPALALPAQFDLLTRRADTFAQFGGFDRAVALREAALLIRPDADEQRVRLVREYTRKATNPVGGPAVPDPKRQPHKQPGWDQHVERAVGEWKRSLRHCEHLVRNRRVARAEGTDLCYYAADGLGLRAASRDWSEPFQPLKRQFIADVMVLLPGLDESVPGRPKQRAGMIDPYTAIFKQATPSTFVAAADLDLLADLITTRLAADQEPSHIVLYFLQNATERGGRGDRYTPAEYAAFLKRLGDSDRPVAKLYGRWGAFCVARAAQRSDPPEELIAESRAIVGHAREIGVDRQSHSAGILAGAEANLVADRQRKEAAVAMPTTRPARASKPAVPAAVVRVTVEPIELELSSAVPNGWELKPFRGGRFRPLGDGLDAVWTRAALRLIREEGRAVEVLSEAKLKITDVVTDGPHIWVGAGDGRGIYVLDRGGKQLALVGAGLGLPPTELNGPFLLPVAPGRVMAVGCFGNERRAWLAMVDYDDKTGAAKVDVFHEARKVEPRDLGTGADDPAAALDPAVGFAPTFVIEHRTGGADPRRLAIVGRDWKPLVVDIETRKVWVYPVKNFYKDETFPRPSGVAEAFASIDGTLWIGDASARYRSYVFDDPAALMRLTHDSRSAEYWSVGTAGSLARAGDWLYHAGDHRWMRHNLETGADETLLDEPRELPNFGSGDPWHLAHSSHYGLVAFHGGILYRVKVDGAAVP